MRQRPAQDGILHAWQLSWSLAALAAGRNAGSRLISAINNRDATRVACLKPPGRISDWPQYEGEGLLAGWFAAPRFERKGMNYSSHPFGKIARRSETKVVEPWSSKASRSLANSAPLNRHCDLWKPSAAGRSRSSFRRSHLWDLQKSFADWLLIKLSAAYSKTTSSEQSVRPSMTNAAAVAARQDVSERRTCS